MAAAPSPLQELVDLTSTAESATLVSEFDLTGGRTLMAQVYLSQQGGRLGGNLRLSEAKGGRRNFKPWAKVSGPDDAMRQVAAAYPEAALRRDTVEVSVQKGAATGAKVRPVAIRAWHEALGQPIPSADELAREKKAAQAARKAKISDTIALLKTGRAGVEAFNKLTPKEHALVDLRKADLSGCELGGLVLGYNADLTGARLGDAKLLKANLVGCRFADADFSGADLTGADGRGSTYLRADFSGANLTDVNLTCSDIRGANFTGADLGGCRFAQARFDEQTKWPRKYQPPADLIWKGAGPDPRQAPTKREKARPRPTDFSGFLDRLKKAADPAKLDKALAMLKADRFRLFARVEQDHVVGVVKSQSDASLVYSCRLASDGKYACCTQNLNICGGLRGSPCKHLLVLIVGLTQAGELDPGLAHDWTQASRGLKPELDKDAMSETFLVYKGAEAGEVDWRPTETIPEDFYAM